MRQIDRKRARTKERETHRKEGKRGRGGWKVKGDQYQVDSRCVYVCMCVRACVCLCVCVCVCVCMPINHISCKGECIRVQMYFDSLSLIHPDWPEKNLATRPDWE